MTLTLDRVIRHTVVFHLSTSTYIPNFIGIGKTFCGRTDGCTDGHLRPTLLGRLYGVHLKIKSFLSHKGSTNLHFFSPQPDINLQIKSTVDLVRLLQLERRRIALSLHCEII